MAKAGTAYVDIQGDLSTLNKQLGAFFGGTQAGGIGKKGGLVIGAGIAAGLGAVAGKSLFDLGGKFDKEFDKIRAGTGKTGKVLRGLEGDFKNVLTTVPGSFDDAGTAVTQLNRRLGLTGKPLRSLATQMLQLSRITGTDLSGNIEAVARAFEDWEVPVRDQSEALDGLFRLGQRSGIAVDDLATSVQRFGSPLRILGFSLGEAAATFATFERVGVNTQTMVPGLKLAIGNLTQPTGALSKSMEELGISAGKPEQALREVFALLGDKSSLSNAQKISLAMEVFGRRAGADMAEAIRQGRFEVDSMFKTFRSGGDTIDKAEKDTRDFAEQWDLLKKRVFVGLEPIASKLFKTIGDGMEALATADFSQIGKGLESFSVDLGLDQLDLGELDLGDTFAGTDEDIKAITGALRDLAGVMSSVFGPIAREVLPGLVQNFRGSFQVIGGVIKTFAALLTLDFDRAWDGVRQIFRGMGNQLAGLVRAMTAPLRVAIRGLVRVIDEPFEAAWAAVKSVFRTGVGAVVSIMRARQEAFRGAARGLGSAIRGGFDVVGRIVSLLKNVMGDALGVLRRTAGTFRDIGGQMGRGLVNALSGALRALGRVVTRAFSGLGRAIKNAINAALPDKIPIPLAPDIPIPQLAKGTRNFKGGLALVGEEGPELAVLPKGSRVYPHRQTKRFIGGPENFGRGAVRQSSSLNAAVRWLVDVMRDKYGLRVSSGIRAGDSGSFHSQGKAVDLIGSRMRQAATWIRTSGLYRALLEGIHNPNLSTDSGKLVSPGFWGAQTWAQHGGSNEHLHLAASFISEAVKRKVLGGGQGGAGKRQPKRLTGGKLSLGQVVTLAKQAGFPDPALAAAVAYAESRGHVRAVGDGGDSIGLWQVNMPAHPRYKKEDLFDARKNAKAALSISRGGKNWRPWTQYRTGAFKQFLGGRATPLPKGVSKAPTGGGSSYADYLALKIEEAVDTPNMKDDVKWINRALRYWRGVYRRNKRTGNWQRASEALGQIKDLRSKKKDLRETADESAFKLGDLSQIGKVNIGGLQGQFDRITLDIANAALTETLDPEGNVVPSSYDDDLSAATRLVTLWENLHRLAMGTWLPSGNGKWVRRPGKVGAPIKGKRGQTTTYGPGWDWVPDGKGLWNQGTSGQKLEAALNLASARDALRSIQSDMKSEEAEAPATGVESEARSIADEIKSFLASLGDLSKNFGPNFKPIANFAGGGRVEAPIGAPVNATVHGGELIVDPRTGALSVKVVGGLPEGSKKIVLNEYHGDVTQVLPEDMHSWSRDAGFQIRAAVE